MKKLIFKILIFGVFKSFSQTPTISTNFPDYVRPMPSVASIMNFAEIPVDEYTGVPNISVPLFNSGTLSNHVAYNLSLDYHPKGISFLDKSSEVGTGWSINFGGSISRIANIRPDEFSVNTQDDLYNYNFMGNTGSFKFKWNSNNEIEGIIHTSNKANLKIEFQKAPNNKEIDYFMIYDTKGIKYKFSVYDVNVGVFNGFVPNNSQIGGKYPVLVEYRSTHHLKEVIDNNDKVIINFNYDNFTKAHENSPGDLLFHIKKISQVNIIGYSNISILYDYYSYMDGYLNTEYHCDPYRLKEVLIKDSNSNLVKRVSLNHNNVLFKIKKLIDNNYYDLYEQNQYRRFLNNIKEYNVNNEETNSTDFAYNLDFDHNQYNLLLDSYGYINVQNQCDLKPSVWYPNPIFSNATSNKSSSTIGIIKNIAYKTGGGHEFEFETNTFSRAITGATTSGVDIISELITDEDFLNYNDDNKQVDLLYDINYNTSIQNQISINIANANSGKKIFFKFENQTQNIPEALAPLEGQEFIPINYILSGNTYNNSSMVSPMLSLPHNFTNHYENGQWHLGEYCYGKSVYLDTGTYNISLVPYMNLQTTGNIKIYQENFKPTIKRFLYGGGNRIKKIKVYEKMKIYNGVLVSADNLTYTTDYDYSSFTDSSKSSGEFADGSIASWGNLYDTSPNALICYKNVKSSLKNNLGYTKSIYFVPSDKLLANAQITYDFSAPLFLGQGLFKNGLLLKNETFDADFKIIQSSENSYKLVTIHDSAFVLGIGIHAVDALGQLTNKTTKNYFYPNGSTTPNILETLETYTYNPINKKISESTVSNSNGETLTTKFFYHTGNSIHSQNRISEIERIETYRASELLSKSQIIYNNNWASNVSFLPKTIVTAKGSENFEARLEYLNYDEFGNPLEIKQDGGIHICYIWGYNKTQPIAKIENATYAQVQAYEANLQNLSNTGTEANLITALNNLRAALPNAMITTYTHKSLIGISTVTDPKGNKQTYHYDSFNRLQYVKDAQGNIVSENEYHYKD